MVILEKNDASDTVIPIPLLSFSRSSVSENVPNLSFPRSSLSENVPNLSFPRRRESRSFYLSIRYIMR